MAVLAPALQRARIEVDKRWPVGNNSSDGWIGDPAHAASGRPENGGSDHNPNYRNVVDALDIDVDGIDCPLLVALLIRHPSVNYVIWNRRIWSRSRGFVVAKYTGSNPHDDHIHVSLIQSIAAENNTTPWGIWTGVVIIPVGNPAPGCDVELSWAQRLAAALPELENSTLIRGSAKKAQALLNAFGAGLRVDGIFGDRTEAAVRSFQASNGLTRDGIIGPKTWAVLIGTMPTTQLNATWTTIVTRRIQSLLNVYGSGLIVDGDFGARTDNAVKQFQRRFGLREDGIVGPITWTALLTK